MCIIIAKDAGVKALDAGYFDRAWDANSHGAGIVWKHKDEDVFFQKGFMDKKEFLDKVAEINKDDTAFIAHFRIRSVGVVCAENTHPFVMNHVTFAHNGTLSLTPFEGKTDSETFGLKFLKTRKMKWIKDNQELLEMALGSSKFAIMDNVTGEILILNKHLGQEKDDAWFSNSSAFEKTSYATTPARNYSYQDQFDFNDYGTRNDYKYGADTTYLGNKVLGTKRYFRKGQHFSKDLGGFVWDNGNIYVLPYTGMTTVVINKRGLWEVKKDIGIPEGLKDHTYGNKDLIYNVILKQQVRLNRAIETYRNGKYKSTYERDSSEYEVQAMNFVLNMVRRLVRANKVVSPDALEAFYKKVLPGAYTGPYDFRQSVPDEILEFCVAYDAALNPDADK